LKISEDKSRFKSASFADYLRRIESVEKGGKEVYELIVETNEYLKHIDTEILNIHKDLRDVYN
jgi:RNA processing factor Prp31